MAKKSKERFIRKFDEPITTYEQIREAKERIVEMGIQEPNNNLMIVKQNDGCRTEDMIRELAENAVMKQTNKEIIIVGGRRAGFNSAAQNTINKLHKERCNCEDLKYFNKLTKMIEYIELYIVKKPNKRINIHGQDIINASTEGHVIEMFLCDQWVSVVPTWDSNRMYRVADDHSIVSESYKHLANLTNTKAFNGAGLHEVIDLYACSDDLDTLFLELSDKYTKTIVQVDDDAIVKLFEKFATYLAEKNPELISSSKLSKETIRLMFEQLTKKCFDEE